MLTTHVRRARPGKLSYRGSSAGTSMSRKPDTEARRREIDAQMKALFQRLEAEPIPDSLAALADSLHEVEKPAKAV
jgi:hypothetical protein